MKKRQWTKQFTASFKFLKFITKNKIILFSTILIVWGVKEIELKNIRIKIAYFTKNFNFIKKKLV